MLGKGGDNGTDGFLDLSVSDPGQIFISLSLFHTLLTHGNKGHNLPQPLGSREAFLPQFDRHTSRAKVTYS